jgi:DNA polymerase IV
VKIKWADFKQSTRSQSFPRMLDTRDQLHAASLGLIRSVFPPRRGIRLVGVTLSNLEPTVGAHDPSHGLLRRMASLDVPTAVLEGARDRSGG